MQLKQHLQKIFKAALPQSAIFWGAMITVFCYSLVVVSCLNFLPHMQAMEAEDITTKTSIAIGLIFAFRVNSSYDRWWEGRKLWGQLVNEMRNLSIKYDLYFDADEEEKMEFGRLVIAFAYALKNHLRDFRYDVEKAGIAPPPHATDHIPLYIAQLIFKNVQSKKRKSSTDQMQLLLLDTHLRSLMDILGACERIKASPIAGWIQASIWIWMMAYFAILPWLLAEQFQLWAVAMTLFAAYFAIALELLAEDMQQPFGLDYNDLPTDQICMNVAKSVKQVLHTDCSAEQIDCIVGKKKS